MKRKELEIHKGRTFYLFGVECAMVRAHASAYMLWVDRDQNGIARYIGDYGTERSAEYCARFYAKERAL